MIKSSNETAAALGRRYLGDERDFLSILSRPSEHAAAWEHSFVFNEDLSSPISNRAADTGQHPEAGDLILLNPHASGFAHAKGGPTGGGGTITPPTTITYYTAGGDAATDYNITIEFRGTWSDALKTGFTAAADLLCRYISADIADVSYNGRPIDDIVITAELKAIDGTGGILGQAGPTAIRTDSYLPALATMEFDIADASKYSEMGLWDDIVFHEMTHSLGFGTIWSYLDLVSRSAFIGESAVIENGGNPVPLERKGGRGTAGSHWAESAFTNELMTGYINSSNYISGVTWASLSDLGYTLSAYPDYLLVA